ncbi:MAG: serine/threonine protein kinase [Lachnospiraceae bacterium]|nr:serine/threonine protein kinase [Lachnospiraceae bacterium]
MAIEMNRSCETEQYQHENTLGEATKQRYIGKYAIVKMLGQGGEGCVYLARDESLGRPVAIKRVWGDHEAAFLKELQHPMLPVVYELLRDNGCYLVMEYIEGISLHNYIRKNGMAKEEQAKLWAEQILAILQYLHTRKPPVIYRDLKPENLIVCPDGRLRLVDFGAACCRNYSGDGSRRMAVSAGYAAPEQFPRAGGGAYADERSDLFAFGRVLYYVLTGADPAYPPYARLPVTGYNPALWDGWERVLRKCMADHPAKRYQVAEEIREDLCVRGRKGTKGTGGAAKRGLIRKIEKRVLLTEKKAAGLIAL